MTPDTKALSELRNVVAQAICRSWCFETGEGTCAVLCMEQLGDVRKKGCGHAERVHGKLADAILTALLSSLSPELAGTNDHG